MESLRIVRRQGTNSSTTFRSWNELNEDLNDFDVKSLDTEEDSVTLHINIADVIDIEISQTKDMLVQLHRMGKGLNAY